VFCKKSLDVVENKENEHGKESQERPRGGRLLKRLDLPQRHGGTEWRSEQECLKG
jgi:hypothetical protein